MRFTLLVLHGVLQQVDDAGGSTALHSGCQMVPQEWLRKAGSAGTIADAAAAAVMTHESVAEQRLA
jgi:hypothetical protein